MHFAPDFALDSEEQLTYSVVRGEERSTTEPKWISHDNQGHQGLAKHI